MAVLILQVVALVLFVLAALNVEVSGFSLVPAGLAFLTLSFIAGAPWVAARIR